MIVVSFFAHSRRDGPLFFLEGGWGVTSEGVAALHHQKPSYRISCSPNDAGIPYKEPLRFHLSIGHTYSPILLWYMARLFCFINYLFIVIFAVLLQRRPLLPIFFSLFFLEGCRWSRYSQPPSKIQVKFSWSSDLCGAVSASVDGFPFLLCKYYSDRFDVSLPEHQLVGTCNVLHDQGIEKEGTQYDEK